MKVCMFSLKGNFNKDIGQGVQRAMYEMSKNIGELMASEGHKFDSIELGRGGSYMKRKISFTLSSLVRNFSGYDIIHSPGPIMYNPPLRGRAKTVTNLYELTVVDKDSPYAVEMANSGTERKETALDIAIRSRVRRTLLNTDYLLAASSQSREEAIRLGFDPERVFSVPLGVDQRFIDQPVSRPSNKNFKVGYLGALNTRKNVKFVINAVRGMEDREVRLEVWGKKLLEYENLAKLADGDSRISFMGFAPEDGLVGIYDSFDVLVHPTLYGGLELEILEAQSRGLPVIIYKKAYLPEEARRYCFEAKDENHAAHIIMDLKNNGYDKRRMQDAMAYARGFTWKRNAEETVAIYKRMLE